MKKNAKKVNMPNDHLQNGVEDTGRLLTKSAARVRLRKVLLIVLALAAIAAIVFVGFRLIGEKRYNDNIEIAEKALSESDYELAETKYLAAVHMNKRRPKAREGLAYVYAIEKKVNESVKIYDELYNETKEEKYKTASREVSEGGLPSDPDLIPAIEKDDEISEITITTGATDGKTRDIALVLDVSGSMEGEPLAEVKNAATRFGDAVLGTTARVGMIAFDDEAQVVLPLTGDNTQIAGAAAQLGTMGGTNIEAGLASAARMLSQSTADRKIIVLMTDGMPNYGLEGDDLAAYADRLKDQGYYVYTLGFFSDMYPGSKSEPQWLLERIASEGCHYEVTDASDLQFFFGDIADQINGVRYNYIRIACPVDVSVEYNGESLSSADTEDRARTSFGTLTFEDAYYEDEDYSEEDAANAVKILRLLEGPDYKISIKGTGTGVMDYTIGFVDDNGEYSDMRYFDKIDVSPETNISTVAKVSDSTKMTVDYDGDGVVDKTYKANAGSHAEIVDSSSTVRLIMIISIMIMGLTMALIVFNTIRRIGFNIKER